MISVIPNQIVSFRTAGTPSFNELNEDCNCTGRDYCQNVLTSDDSPVQFGLTEYDGQNLVVEGDFAQPCGVVWTCGPDWNIVPATYAEKLPTGVGMLTQDIGIKDNQYYKCTFTLDLNSGNAVEVLLGGNTAFVVNAIDGDGTYTFYYWATGSTNGEIAFFINGAGATARIMDVSVNIMSSVGYRIKDSEGNLEYESYSGSAVSYYENASSTFTPPTSIRAMLTIDWNLVSTDGCYSLCIVDTGEMGVNLIVDGNFPAGTPHWTIVNNGVPPPGWVLNPFTAQHIPTGAGQDTLTQNYMTPPDELKCYIGQFEIFNFISGEVIVRGIPSATTYGTFAGNGIVNFSIPLGSTDTGLRFIADNFSAPNYEIRGISVSVDGPCLFDVLESECFAVQSSCDCCIQFTATNDENAFGMDFNNFAFVQTFRHCAKVYQPAYPRNDKDVFRDSSGDRSMLYSSVTKVSRLKIMALPEYIHDAFNLMFEMDTFQISGVQYSFEDDTYDPEWVNSSLLAPVELRVIKTPQDLVNDNC